MKKLEYPSFKLERNGKFQVKGLQKTSLVDFPPYVSCTLFVSRCNFRCGFCHNADLVMDSLDDIPEDEIFAFLEKRKKVLDGVCISGGEPLLNEDIINLIKNIKKLDYKVKVDTNGTNPDLLKKLIDSKLVDYIAMDIKSSLDSYDKAAGVKVDKSKIKASVNILMEDNVDYEFRMTTVPNLHSSEEYSKIGNWLKGAKKFIIQQFRNDKCLDKSFEKIKPYSKKELEEFKGILEKDISKVIVR
ncbi:MAG: anaerobic ribonucleoside-triphosphate reductase activating protein [Nanoarchaeota archaeon]